MINYWSTLLRGKLRNSKLTKKIGDDKLVVSLILVAVGVLLCIFYKTEIIAGVKKGIEGISSQLDELFTKLD